ncbi:MAG: hypothetical protein RQ936_07410 [Gammaproteobacteria bacterium]|nr:hypothetical protein [Gammaproteobacteria bacterium]
MRDYDNMPVLDWNELNVPKKASAQILHQEPVILQMQDNFNSSVDADSFGCQIQSDTGILYNCDGHKILQQLSTQNKLPGLNAVADACLESSSRVDIDSNHNRIIVHD